LRLGVLARGCSFFGINIMAERDLFKISRLSIGANNVLRFRRFHGFISALSRPPAPALIPNRLMKRSLERCRNAGVQPATPLNSKRAGKMPARQRASRRLFHPPAKSPAANLTSSIPPQDAASTPP
jgi:hypothetical protein